MPGTSKGSSPCLAQEGRVVGKGAGFGEWKGGIMESLTPLEDWVVVERLGAENKEEGKPRRGRVLAVGSGRQLESGRHIPCCTKAGDIVIFGPYSGYKVPVADKEHLLLREREVLAKVNTKK